MKRQQLLPTNRTTPTQSKLQTKTFFCVLGERDLHMQSSGFPSPNPLLFLLLQATWYPIGMKVREKKLEATERLEISIRPISQNGMDGTTSVRRHNSVPGGRWNSVAYRGDGAKSMPANGKERQKNSFTHSLIR